MMEFLLTHFWLVGSIVLKIAVIVLVLILCVAYLTFLERKVIGYIQNRIGPNRIGPRGLLQPFADVFKLLQKELIMPTVANKVLFVIAPIISLATALAAWAVIPFDQGVVLANINAGVLYTLSLSSLGIYGVLMVGWAANSKYALFGALRAAAQSISYEIAMGFALVGVMMAAGSLNFQEIVNAQQGGFWHWYVFALPAPQIFAFVVYVISAVAETNRVPFDLPEAESELVAGFFTEYSGMRFAFFFIAEYANMVLVSCVAAALFLGGWTSPWPGTIPEYLGMPQLAWVEGIFMFTVKVYTFLFLFFWLRATLPRLRYDQLMKFGWKVMLPIALGNIVVTSIAVYLFPRG